MKPLQTCEKHGMAFELGMQCPDCRESERKKAQYRRRKEKRGCATSAWLTILLFGLASLAWAQPNPASLPQPMPKPAIRDLC